MNAQEKILIVDDEPDTILILQDRLEMEGYEVVTATDGGDALELIDRDLPDLILLDIQMPRLDGIETLTHIHEKYPGILVLMLTAHGTIQRAVEATKRGAYDFLEKPFQPEHITQKVDQALEHRRTIEQSTRDELIHNYEEIVGESPPILEVLKIIEKVADTGSTVLVQGESGTGKELVARALHQNSSREKQEMVVVNCAAIPDHLLESELFGHERGAFTGAHRASAGRFRQAEGGTLFLDEIGDMPPDAQTRLLRVLQEGEFNPVGGMIPVQADVRIVAATHRDLGALVREGLFREDLYYRLNVVPIRMPPLRDRLEDLPLLTRHLLARASEDGMEPKRISEEALSRLTEHTWPGNVRELENLLRRMVVLTAGDVISADTVEEELGSADQSPVRPDTEGSTLGASVERHLHRYFAAHGDALPPAGLYRRFVQEVERPLILRTLRATGGNQIRAAELLGINRNTLRKKIRDLDLRALPRRRRAAQ